MREQARMTALPVPVYNCHACNCGEQVVAQIQLDLKLETAVASIDIK